MFKAFMDEGGTDSGRGVVVAGYAGSESECDRVATRWAEIVGPICEFHGLDFFRRNPDGTMKGVYKLQSVSFVESVVTDLIDLLSSSNLEPIGLALDAEAFKDLSEDERRWLTSTVVPGKTWPMQGAPNNPYFACFLYCLNQSNDYTSQGKKIYITFDRHEDYESKGRMLYNDLIAKGDKWGDRLGETLLYSSRYEAVLLQAADLLAYITRVSVTKENIRSKIARYALEKLAYGRDYMRVLDQKGLDSFLKKCPFRRTFWNGEGYEIGDFLEQLRAQGIKVVAVKGDNDVYLSHHIKRHRVKPLYELPDPKPNNGKG